MSLEQKIEEFKSSNTRKSERIEKLFTNANEALRETGIEDVALKEGDFVSDFTLNNAKGEAVNLNDLLAKGSLVVTFYRGNW
ncbi:MAG: hypothetical protein ACRDDL_08335 [Sarcina sp.]